MPLTLAGILPKVRFPVFAMDPTHWQGTAFVPAHASLTGASDDEIFHVQLVYLDAPSVPTRGALVSNIRADAIDRVKVSALDLHLRDFVFRFDEDEARRRWGREAAFEPDEFDIHYIADADTARAWTMRRHRSLPLEIVDPLLHGAGDTLVATWNVPALSIVARLEEVTPSFAERFDERSRQSH